jgi:hypothetical protein
VLCTSMINEDNSHFMPPRKAAPTNAVGHGIRP